MIYWLNRLTTGHINWAPCFRRSLQSLQLSAGLSSCSLPVHFLLSCPQLNLLKMFMKLTPSCSAAHGSSWCLSMPGSESWKWRISARSFRASQASSSTCSCVKASSSNTRSCSSPTRSESRVVAAFSWVGFVDSWCFIWWLSICIVPQGAGSRGGSQRCFHPILVKTSSRPARMLVSRAVRVQYESRHKPLIPHIHFFVFPS